ncbi:MAG: type II toxin-antitoxin system RelE/ParE family toxin [Acidobacteriaceae bacterium]
MYEAPDGKVPFSEWMDRIEGQAIYGVVMARLERVEQGNFGDHHRVGEGVSELVIDFGPGYRVYYGQDGTDLVILLIGGAKATQQRDIETAKRYWGNYNA